MSFGRRKCQACDVRGLNNKLQSALEHAARQTADKNATPMILLFCVVVTVVTSRRFKEDPCHGLPDDTFIVNPKGCKYFFNCKNGSSVGAYCPHGLLFNPEDRICDLPAHVDCHFDDPAPTSTTTTTTMKPTRTPWTPSSPTKTSPTKTIAPTTTTELPIIDGDQDEVVCPMHDADVIQFVASKINCRHYYICYHGRAVVQECSENLHWNSKAKKCVRPADAECTILSRPPMRFPKCPNNGSRFYPHPTECDYYIYCRSGFYSIQQCPFYHHWDVTTESCRWRRFTQCAATKRRRLLPGRNNSRKYF